MGMDAHRKLEFVHAMTKLGLKHFDAGGGVLSGNSVATGGNQVANPTGGFNPAGKAYGALATPISNGLAGVGGVAQGVASDLTAQNTFSAAAPTSATTVGQQQATLAGELENEAAGNGPNPAQSQYLQNAQNIAGAQATNYAQNRALNPGLAARMAGNTAASTGQAAAAQAGTQQAQQQLNSQATLEGLTGQEQTGALSAQGINAQVAQNNTNAVNQTEGGLLGGAGSVLTSLLAKGGEVKKMATGGSIQVSGVPEFSNASQTTDSPNSKGPFSSIGKMLGSGGGSSSASASAMAKGGNVKMDPTLLVQMPAPSELMTKGGKVNAMNKKEKAVAKDDSQKNDKVPAMLSEGEIVIPRHITEHPMAPQKAAAFVQAVLAKRKATGARAAA